MNVQKRTMNWMPRESAWNAAKNQSAKRKAASQAFLDQQSSLADVFQSTRDNLTMSAAEITGRKAAARVQSEAAAKTVDTTA